MKQLRLICCLAVALVGFLAPPFALANIPDEVRAADDARLAATLSVDLGKLDTLLSDQLGYGHSNGRMQTKSEFIGALRSQAIIYRSYDYEERIVTPHGDNFASMSGIAHLSGSAGPNSISFRLRFLALWERENGHWKLTAYQSAQLPRVIAPADQPAPKTGNRRFFDLHQSFLERTQSGPVGLLFLGDSITYHWRKAPHIWEHYYGAYQPANFGIGGDQTQHILWRIDQGELDGIAPKVVVLMIGTNNTYFHSAEQIAAGNRAIIHRIQEKLPETKILLLGIFPRGPRLKDNPPNRTFAQRMAIINAVNTELATLDDGDRVRYLNINEHFLGNDGTIPNTIMPDQLHPNAVGYQIWADAMHPLLTEMMGESE